MSHTFKEIMKTYDAEKIQLIFGAHIVNISTKCEGSLALFRIFENVKFTNLVWYPESKYLEIFY